MDLSLISQFDAAPAAVMAVYDSPAFAARLAEMSGMDKTILEAREEDGVLHRRTQVEGREPLPKFVAKVFGSEKLTYIQLDHVDLATCSSTWSVEIPGLGKRVSVSGTTTFTPTATGCQRDVRGTVTVRVPVIGRRIEKRVASDFEKKAASAVEIARSLLQDG